MRILFIVGPFPLISETFILNQITGLIDRGHDVHIFATKMTDVPNVLHADVEKYKLLRRVRYRMQTSRNRTKRHIGWIQLLSETAFTHPRMLISAMNAKRQIKRISLFPILSDIKSLSGICPFDVIHCHFGFHGNRAMVLRDVGVLRGRLITTFHAVDLTVMLNQSGEDLYSRLFQEGDLFLPISQRWQQRLIELGCDPNRIKVHRMGIDCHLFAFKQRKPSSDGTFRITSVARFVEKKGIAFGIRAVARLIKEYDNIEYTIIGDGPLRVDLDALVMDLGVQNCVKLVGWKEQHQVVRILESSHVFLAPSITAANGDQEGIPVVLMEAMAMGMPVITTWHSGIPELVQDGRCGCLVNERDVDGLYEKLKYLAENPRCWAEMGSQGRKIVQKEYDVNKLNDELVEIYRSL